MRRWLFVSSLIAGLVLLGLGTLRGDMLALAIPLLIYAGASLLGRPEPPQLSATRSFSAQRPASGEHWPEPFDRRWPRRGSVAA